MGLRWVRVRDSCPQTSFLRCVSPIWANTPTRSNVLTSPASLLAAQAHLGQGVASKGPIHGWNGTGALTPISRFATMFSGTGIKNANGTEWYFPQRLTDDANVVDNGNSNPAQSVLDVDATMGHSLPKNLLIYAFGARRGGASIPEDARHWPNSRAFP